MLDCMCNNRNAMCILNAPENATKIELFRSSKVAFSSLYLELIVPVVG